MLPDAFCRLSESAWLEEERARSSFRVAGGWLALYVYDKRIVPRNRPVCPLAAAMCRSPLPLFLSTAAVRIVPGVVERLLAKRSTAAFRSVVSPRRAR